MKIGSNLTDELLLLARCAALAYEGNGVPQGGASYKRELILDDEETGLYMCAFTGDNKNVIAIRGTRANNIPNLVEDALLGVWFPQSLPKALQALLAFRQGKKNLTLTGHSLGGGIAGLLAYIVDLPCTGFNSAPVKCLTRKLGLARRGQNILNINDRYDPVSHMLFHTQVGDRFDIVENELAKPPNFIERLWMQFHNAARCRNALHHHAMQTVLDQLENMRQTSSYNTAIPTDTRDGAL